MGANNMSFDSGDVIVRGPSENNLSIDEINY